MPLYISLAANSGVFIMGIGKSFLSVIGVLIKPGLTTETLTPYLFKSKNKLSEKLVNADFDAQYAPAAGRPL